MCNQANASRVAGRVNYNFTCVTWFSSHRFARDYTLPAAPQTETYFRRSCPAEFSTETRGSDELEQREPSVDENNDAYSIQVPCPDRSG